MEKIMAVYDVDPAYARRFADVTNQKERVPFDVIPFTSMEALQEYGKKHKIEILLISSTVPREQAEAIGAGSVVTLAEGEIVKSVDSYPEEAGLVVRGRKARILGIYSPIGRCLKTSLALTLGQQLARDGKVLYLGLDAFAGFSRLIGNSCKNDLSDVLYFFRQGDLTVMRLRSIVYTWQEMDYLTPVRYQEDLEQMTGEETGKLLEKLALEMGYEYLVVDVGRPGGSLLPILGVCDIVYMPVKEDGISAARLEELDEYLEMVERPDIQEKIRRVKLPYHNDFGRRET